MNLSPVAALVALPPMLALGWVLHGVAASVAKAVLRAAGPLPQGEGTIAEYERRVLSTAEAGVVPVVAAATAAGLAGWLALVTGVGVLWLGLLAALAVAVWTDLRAWDRVAVSANRIWVRRGQGRPVESMPIERIADVGVDTAEVEAFTPRHGGRGEVSRLWLRLTDGSVVVLPPTEAARGEEAVEEVANQVRARRAQWLSRGALREAEQRGAAAARAAATAPPRSPDDAELALALQRLRQQALAPEGPRPAATPARRPPGAG